MLSQTTGTSLLRPLCHGKGEHPPLGLGGVPAGQPSFRDRLAADPEVAAKLSKEDLDHAFDIRHHTRFSGAIIDRALRDKDH